MCKKAKTKECRISNLLLGWNIRETKRTVGGLLG